MNEQSDNTRDKTLQEAEKQILRSAFLALAALAVIVFACYAWFASNRTVTGEIGSVRLSGSNFELASVGDVGGVDSRGESIITKILGERAGEGSPWSNSEDQTGTITGQKSDIYWNVSSNNHFGNLTAGDGIQPGAEGTMLFYVVPQRPGTLTLQFDVQLIPLREIDKNNVEQVTNDNTLNPLLRGHILFAYAKGEESLQVLDVNGSTFTMTFDVDENCSAIPVQLYWCWPEFLDDALKNVTFGASVNQWLSNQMYMEYFFHDPSLASNENIRIPDFSDDSNDSVTYNNLYNNADQYIGETIHYVILQLVAEETASS